MPNATHFEGVIALKPSCSVHLSHIAYVYFKAHLFALFTHFRFSEIVSAFSEILTRYSCNLVAPLPMGKQ